MSKLSSDSNNPMTCGFVYENRENCMNRGHFGGLRQKLGNDRALTMVEGFENSRMSRRVTAILREADDHQFPRHFIKRLSLNN